MNNTKSASFKLLLSYFFSVVIFAGLIAILFFG